jgi:hypothetical protein
MKFSKNNLAMTGFFMVVLFPIRYFSMLLVGDSWIGSFGILTAISLLITVLAIKNKLGWFGKAFITFFINRGKGKRKYITIFFMTTTMGISLMMIYAVHHAETAEKTMMMDMLPEGVDSIEDVNKLAYDVDIQTIVIGLLLMPLFILTHFDSFMTMVAVVNDMSHGMYLNLATIIFVEELEFVGLILFYRFKFKVVA